jgi:hypothetical protein
MSTPDYNDISRIEDALDALVTTVMRHRKRRRPTPSYGRLHFIAISRWDNEPTPSQEDCEVDRIIHDPIEGAYGHAVRLLGKRLHKLGGVGLMQDVCERVASRDRGNYGRRGTFIERRWDMIGDPQRGGIWSP